MSYESRIYVVEVERHEYDGESCVYAEKICMFNMCAMDGAFHRLFKAEIDYDLYERDDDITVDCYGDRCKSAPLADVIGYLRQCIEQGDTYRRLKPCLSMLEGFDPACWSGLEVVHYGY